MATFKEKQIFALNAIRPYWKDPSICGYDGTMCVYLTLDGRKCVLGKYLLHPKNVPPNIELRVLFVEGQINILKPEAVDILTASEWAKLQEIHDSIAVSFYVKTDLKVSNAIRNLGLFTKADLDME
jgi:hypothetical protein